MRIFKYWIEHSTDLDIQGIRQKSKALGGSNISIEAARQDAEKKLQKAQEIINGTSRDEKGYEADIVEEIIEIINPENIITRNRYGALILNSKHLMFIDIDKYQKTIIDYFFRSGMSPKELMLKRIRKIASHNKYSQYGIRIYETYQGYRLIVANEKFTGNSDKSNRIMKAFKADITYQWLCKKQNCYRARLSPKPYRIKQKGIRVIYPSRTSTQELELTNWIKEYEEKSRKYVVCKFIDQIGAIRSEERIIDYHDRMAGISRTGPLA